MAASPSSSSSSNFCKWPPCRKRVHGSKHETCCILHFNFAMAIKIDPSSTFSSLSHNSRNGLCMLPGCCLHSYPGHDFCTKTHALLFLSQYLRDLKHQNRLCKMQGCIRHVFVEDPGPHGSPRVHDFCGWKHAKQYLTLKDITVQENSLEYMIAALKKWAMEGKETRGVEVDENLFLKHPWEVMTRPGFSSKHMIAKCKFKRNSETDRDMTTKEGMHWKQQGRKAEATEKITVDDCKVSKRYLTYSQLRSSTGKQPSLTKGESSRKRRLESSELHGKEEMNMGYTMIEYKIVDDPTMDHVYRKWCLVKLCAPHCAVAQRRGKARKRESNKEIGQEEAAFGAVEGVSSTDDHPIFCWPLDPHYNGEHHDDDDDENDPNSLILFPELGSGNPYSDWSSFI